MAAVNMAAQCLAHPPGQAAILDWDGQAAHPVSYGDLAAMTARLVAALDPAPGERIGVLRSQGAWCAAGHLAAWWAGAISVPLFKLFGPDALALRLGDAGVTAVVTDPDGAAMLAPFPGLRVIVPESGLPGPDPRPCAATGPDDPAIIIYTSGTTGAPKGALHGHRLLDGHLPGVILSHDGLGQPGDCLWTPADWAWIGGLFDVALPALALGVPVVAARLPRFDSADAARLMAACGVRNVFFPPTALKRLKADGVVIPGLRSVCAAGEPLGAELPAWGLEAFGVRINEFYGQTECNMVATQAHSRWPGRPGCMGRPVPGFTVAVIDADGRRTDAEGDIAIARGAPTMFLGYWNRPEATAHKFRGDWMLTGDRGLMDGAELRFLGRDDDVITSAGYRIGPTEIEDALLTHPAVAQVGVVGRPDPDRTEAVMAWIVVRDGITTSDALAAALQDHARTRCAAHSYPRAIRFVDALPMTVTGKVIRAELRRRAIAEMQAEAPR